MDKRERVKLIIVLLFSFFLEANEDFITKDEYASQLYKNPRGISCVLCHNKDGSSKLIAKYTHKQRARELKTSQINNLKYEDFYKALNSRILGMPRYFLTDSEIKLLYYYLQKQKKK